MARNGSGTMSVVNSFSSGTTISSAEMNANFSDFASEVTNSLPRDGQAAMTGQLKITAGTAAAPGLIFSTDTDTGVYRVAANTLGVSVGGALVAQFDSTGAQTAAGENYDAFPSGTQMLFYQATAPTGWTGRDDIGDYALRVVTDTSDDGGSTGGSSSFTSVFTSRTIAQANLPNVNLTAASNGDHTHFVTNGDGGASVVSVLSTNYVRNARAIGTNADNYGLFGSASTADRGLTNSDGAHTHTVPLGGSGTALDFSVLYASVIIAAKD